jgi:sodium-dependent dicarboxylate transporter 2/3/5
LGPYSFSEKVISSVLVILALLWFTRAGFGDDYPGWGALFGNMPGDGTVAMLLSVSLFLIPSRSGDNRKRIMDWEAMKELPWGVIILLGKSIDLL